MLYILIYISHKLLKTNKKAGTGIIQAPAALSFLRFQKDIILAASFSHPDAYLRFHGKARKARKPSE